MMAHSQRSRAPLAAIQFLNNTSTVCFESQAFAALRQPQTQKERRSNAGHPGAHDA